MFDYYSVFSFSSFFTLCDSSLLKEKQHPTYDVTKCKVSVVEHSSLHLESDELTLFSYFIHRYIPCLLVVSVEW